SPQTLEAFMFARSRTFYTVAVLAFPALAIINITACSSDLAEPGGGGTGGEGPAAIGGTSSGGATLASGGNPGGTAGSGGLGPTTGGSGGGGDATGGAGTGGAGTVDVECLLPKLPDDLSELPRNEKLP